MSKEINLKTVIQATESTENTEKDKVSPYSRTHPKGARHSHCILPFLLCDLCVLYG
jgi:hypothetical protein